MTGQAIAGICVAGMLVCDMAVSSGLLPWGAALIGAIAFAYGAGRGISRMIGSKNER